MRRAVIAAAALVLALGPLAAGMAPANAGDVSAGSTTVTFRIPGCDGCKIRGGQVDDPYGTPYDTPTATVRNGVARMVVDTDRTQGMTFFLDVPWQVMINAEPLIAFQYKGIPAGTSVTKADVLASKKASACWAGTTSSAVTLDIRLRTTRVPAFNPEVTDPGTTRAPLAWVEPTQAALPPFEPLFEGVLAAQDYTLCELG